VSLAFPIAIGIRIVALSDMTPFGACQIFGRTFRFCLQGRTAVVLRQNNDNVYTSKEFINCRHCNDVIVALV
jgi:hypothetical protein